MSLINQDAFHTVVGDFLEPEDLCFHCGKQLESLPVIMWKGSSVQIWLHVDCAKSLGAGILRDYAEFKFGKEKADDIHRNFKANNS